MHVYIVVHVYIVRRGHSSSRCAYGVHVFTLLCMYTLFGVRCDAVTHKCASVIQPTLPCASARVHTWWQPLVHRMVAGQERFRLHRSGFSLGA